MPKEGKRIHRWKGRPLQAQEYEDFYYSDLTDDEKVFLSHDDCFLDARYQELNLLRILTLREIELSWYRQRMSD